MSDLDTLRDDLAFMKALASDDGRQDTTVGAMFVAAGLLYGLPLFVVWATLRGLLDLSAGWTPWVSLWSTVAYLPFVAWLGWRRRRSRAPMGPTGRAMAGLWGTVGLTTLVILFTIFWTDARMHVDWMWQVWCSICFALYGSAWLGVAIASRRRGWALVAAGSYLNAVVNALLIGGPDILLGVAVGITLWLGAPGVVIILRRAAAAAA